MILLVFSLFYYIWRCLINTIAVPGVEGASGAGLVWAYVLGYIRVVWNNGATDAFWYLYMYLGLLVMMPVFQLAASVFMPDGQDKGTGSVQTKLNPDTSCRLSSKHLICIIAVASVYVSVIPSIAILYPDFAYTEYFDIPMLTCGVLYLFIGHAFYLYRDRIGAGAGLKLSDLKYAVVFVVAFVINMLLSEAEYAMTLGEWNVSYSEIYTVTMLIESVSAFMIFIKIKVPGRVGDIVEFLAPATFGIYLFADFVCSNTHMVYYYLCPHMNRLAAVAIQDIVAYTAALVITLALRFIPGVKKWL